MHNFIQILSILSIALMSGLFYGWSISVIPGLAKINDLAYLQAFQSMNKAIINPFFFLAFIGSIILLSGLTIYTASTGMNQKFYLLLTACLLYVFGTIAVTFFGNVPLNNQLEILQLNELSSSELENFRNIFESKWNFLNTIRTISSLIALILLLLSCFIKSQ